MASNDPALPPNLARDLAELRRRLKDQEASNRLQASSVQGGTVVVLDDDGNTIAQIGRILDVTDGFDLQGDGGTVGMMHVSSELGWALPYMVTSTWINPTEATTITSGSFVDAYLARAEQNLAEHLRFTCYVATDAATTAEVKVLFGGVTIGDTLSVAGSHAAYHDFAAPTNGILFAGAYSVQLQARRTGGAGNVYIYRPYALVMGDFSGVVNATGWLN